eukprot:15430656-Alexandrium_andersonii.AAC.1
MILLLASTLKKPTPSASPRPEQFWRRAQRGYPPGGRVGPVCDLEGCREYALNVLVLQARVLRCCRQLEHQARNLSGKVGARPRPGIAPA